MTSQLADLEKRLKSAGFYIGDWHRQRLAETVFLFLGRNSVTIRRLEFQIQYYSRYTSVFIKLFTGEFTFSERILGVGVDV